MTDPRDASSADDETRRHERDVAVEAAREAGAILSHHFEHGSESWEKSKNNPVTAADLEADAAIRAHLARAFPEDGLLTEESSDDGARRGRSRCWIVDPMDGTREFTERRPEFAVSIALVEYERPVVAVVYNPIFDVLYEARIGLGCLRNGETARVSDCTDLASASAIASRSEIEGGALEALRPRFGSLVATGSIAWKLALVAGGEADFNVSLRGKREWDVCAGDLLVHEAGGRYVDSAGVTRRYNQADPLSRAPMAAGNPDLLDAFLAMPPTCESD